MKTITDDNLYRTEARLLRWTDAFVLPADPSLLFEVHALTRLDDDLVSVETRMFDLLPDGSTRVWSEAPYWVTLHKGDEVLVVIEEDQA